VEVETMSEQNSLNLSHVFRADGGGARPRLLAVFTADRTRQLDSIARGVLRHGLVALLLLWGGMKFFQFEAEAIRPLIENHPLMSWMYPAFGVRGASAVIGVIELLSAALIAVRRFAPQVSAIGSLIAAGTFVVTLSFLITTPGVLSPTSAMGGFIMKDLILLGAALYTAAEAISATRTSTKDSLS
jgi:reactive chlorine resistance protein C